MEKVNELQSNQEGGGGMSKLTVEQQARGRARRISEKANVMGPPVPSANIWPVVPYLVRISVAKKDPTYKHATDSRYNGWREIWAKCDFELFDRALTKKLREVYLLETLDYADSLPMVVMFTKRLSIMAADSMSFASAYRYYGDKKKVSHRIGVELVKPTISVPLNELLGFNTKGSAL